MNQRTTRSTSSGKVVGRKQSTDSHVTKRTGASVITENSGKIIKRGEVTVKVSGRKSPRYVDTGVAGVVYANKATALFIGADLKARKVVSGDVVELEPLSGEIYKVFVNRANLSFKEQQALFHITPATLARRLNQKAAFTKTESDHVLRVAEVYRLAGEIFGTEEKARLWMAQASPVLNGNRPKDLLVSSAGIDEVKDELLRIAYGVFA